MYRSTPWVRAAAQVERMMRMFRPLLMSRTQTSREPSVVRPKALFDPTLPLAFQSLKGNRTSSRWVPRGLDGIGERRRLWMNAAVATSSMPQGARVQRHADYWLLCECWPPGSDTPHKAALAVPLGPSDKAMSPSETIPTSRLSRLITGRRRTFTSAIFAATSSSF